MRWSAVHAHLSMETTIYKLVEARAVVSGFGDTIAYEHERGNGTGIVMLKVSLHGWEFHVPAGAPYIERLDEYLAVKGVFRTIAPTQYWSLF